MAAPVAGYGEGRSKEVLKRGAGLRTGSTTKSPMFKSQSRFVTLLDGSGKQICAPIIVEFAELSYAVSDAEFEFRAIRIAVADGLLAADQIGAVRARVGV